ncbi:hypothetical protein [Catenulispora rubra]|uniref:hypothetical protein n=1 Tax=Catenulispora rubra TaxID=280293 RepID=UPI0018924AFA|nr:hypothetical protein [Catenulispora rubra]
MADDDQTERDTVPLPDAENPAPEVPPAHGHLIAASATSGPGAARPIASPFQIAPPPGDDADVDSIAVTSSRTGSEAAPDDDVELEIPDNRSPLSADPRARTVRLSPVGASGRSKGLIAAAVAGVLVVGGAVAATVGGGSGKSANKAAAPTAGLIGEQVSSSGDGGYASSSASGSPWVWQTGQSTAKYPGATTTSTSTSVPGAPKPTGSSSVPGTTQSSGPGMPQRSASAPGVPSAPVPPSATPATVTLVAGPGCAKPAGGGYSADGSGADSGWGGNGSGGWGSDGCNGSMQSMPMTGDSSNGANKAVWSFGSGTAGFASCVVSVYVPWDGKATDTGGTAAGYQVSAGSVVTRFTVDQNATHGQWTVLGTVAVGGTAVKLTLLDHGIDYPAGWRYGVSAARLQCTA